ncbi:protein ovarian tumor locus isoform X2 [Ceratitis capitata]|uniref:protein ovarian tumor locus isoform X2 n=1 Tax=Ceratitis capitata TaxID=7213 RepID=UPI000329C2AE|nr:protein ovarian tumor locus isoform X2 [Ceratitis capitata]
MQRQFTSGSRQAPDPFDQFLEENNFYRKHTARDASCLFRVISEQMYDTQLHHLAIRKKCVRYMRKHRDFFAPLVERDLDEYLDDMSKPKTYGTLVELQAVGYMFQRNVLLFEPFNLGNFYSTRSYFNDVFRVFYTPERHFDSVFTCDYIKDAAICQAICYEILYKDLYKLPDVAFAVEHMLHSPTLEATEYTSESNEDGYCTRILLSDGRSFDFDLPNDTNCILENYELCHFHYQNFPRLSDDLQREMKIHNNCDDYEKSALCKTAESLLPHKYISCVRQLLQEGITPFPYKVAKALDPNMYRNIEFDAWNEQRKEQKLQNWYNGDTNFKVGAKCHVRLCKSENDLYTCHIQEIAVDKGYCIVFIEQLGEKRLVPYESLTPLPPDQFKPWTLPYRFQRHMQKYSSVRLTRHYNYRLKLNGQFGHDYCAPMSPSIKSSEYVPGFTGSDLDKDDKQHYGPATAQHRNGCFYKLKQYTHFENFRAHTVEYCAMPLTVEHTPRDYESKSVSGASMTPSNENINVVPSNSLPQIHIKTESNMQPQHASAPEEMMGNFNPMEQVAGMGAPAFIVPDMHYLYPMPQYSGEEYYTYGYDPAMQPPTATLMPTGYYMYPPTGAPPTAFAPAPNNMYMPTTAQLPPPPPPLIAAAAAPHPAQNCGGPYYQTNAPFGSNVSPGNRFEPVPLQVSAQQSYETPTTRNRGSVQAPNLNTPSSGFINWDAKKSVDANGNDLPTDVYTLRHFYNLGLEHHLNQLKQRNNEDASSKANVGKGASQVNGGNQQEEMKSDANNNSVSELNANLTQDTANLKSNSNTQGAATLATTSNQNQQNSNLISNSNNSKGGATGSMHRRFPSRYFNSNKERPLFLRNQSNASNNNNNANSGTSTAPHQNDCTNNGGGNKYVGSTKNNNNGGQTNSNRSATPNSTHSHASNNAKSRNDNTGMASLAVSVAEHGMPSPQGNYENSTNGKCGTQNGGKALKPVPLSTYQTPQGNTFITTPYSPYNEFNANEPTMSVMPPNSGGPGGIYLHMPMPTTAHPFGIYAPPPPPPPPQQQQSAASMIMHPAQTFVPPHHNGGPPLQQHQHFIQSPSDAVAAMNMSLPPPPPSNGFYIPPTADLANTEATGVPPVMHGSVGGDGLQFQCISYPGTAPSPGHMPFYYAPGPVMAGPSPAGMTINGIATMQQPLQANATTGNVNAVNGPQGTQVFWSQPPPNALLPLPTSAPQLNGPTAVSSTTPSNNSTPNLNPSSANSRTRDNK